MHVRDAGSFGLFIPGQAPRTLAGIPAKAATGKGFKFHI